jgi:hypothetical protein
VTVDGKPGVLLVDSSGKVVPGAGLAPIPPGKKRGE